MTYLNLFSNHFYLFGWGFFSLCYTYNHAIYENKQLCFFVFDLNMFLVPSCLTGPSKILLNNIGKCGHFCFTFLSQGKELYIFCLMLDEFVENALLTLGNSVLVLTIIFCFVHKRLLNSVSYLYEIILVCLFFFLNRFAWEFLFQQFASLHIYLAFTPVLVLVSQKLVQEVTNLVQV